MKTLTLFVSSPGDVRAERQIVGKVIEKLQARYWNFIRLEPVLWEKEPLRATGTFQKEIVRPSRCDLVVGILWNRLGTPLPKEFAKLDGGRWNSGTEWELHDAVAGYEQQVVAVGESKARPHVLVYKRTARRLVEETEEKENEAREQAEKLRAFEDEFFFNSDGSAKRARFTYETLESFEQTFETHLNELVRDELAAFAKQDGEIPIVPVSGSPFKGLRAFEVADAPLFFGRFRAISEVLEQLQAQKEVGNAFVMIYGSSGFGKSSLMRAGVASRLIEPGFIPGTDAWRHATLYPARGDGSLCENVARAVFGALPELASVPFDNASPWDVARLTRALEADSRSAFDALTFALDTAAAQDTQFPAELNRPACGHLCLLLDQFEEVFTCEDPASTFEQRERFFHALGLLSTHPRIWILTTMRSEYFPRLADHEVLKSLTERDGGYLLTRPELTELNQIIRYPALAAGLGFDTDRETNESLSARIYQDMISDPGALPLLQFCLEELYARREQSPDAKLTWAAYREMGGLRGSIATVADTAWESLGDSAKAAQNHVFSELVTISEDQRALAVRKDADYDCIAGSSPGAQSFLDAFIGANLLITNGMIDGESSEEAKTRAHLGKKTVTLAHEALVTHWPILRDWIEEHRHLLRSRRRLAEQCAQWIEQKRDRQHLLSEGRLRQAQDVVECGFFQLAPEEKELLDSSTQRARNKLGFARATTVAFGFLALVAGWFYWQAETERVNAQQAEARALAGEAEAIQQRSAAERALELAEANARSARASEATAKKERAAADRERATAERARLLAEEAKRDAEKAQKQAQASETRAKSEGAEAKRQAEIAKAALADAKRNMDRAELAESDAEKQRLSVGQERDRASELLAILVGMQGKLKNYVPLSIEEEILEEADRYFSELERTLTNKEKPLLATYLLGRGRLAYLGGNMDSAVQFFEESREDWAELLGQEPGNRDYKERLAHAYSGIGRSNKELGKTQEAQDNLSKSVTQLRELVSMDPGNANLKFQLARDLGTLASIAPLLGGDDTPIYEEAMALYDGLIAADPNNLAYQQNQSALLAGLSDARFRAGQHGEALALDQKGLEIAEGLVAIRPENRGFQVLLGDAYYSLGRRQMMMGDSKSALASAKSSAAIHATLSEFDETNALYHKLLGRTETLLGQIYSNLGEIDLAIVQFQRGLKIAEELSEKEPNDVSLLRDQSVAHANIAAAKEGKGELQEALGHYVKDFRIAEKILKQDPLNRQNQEDMATSHCYAGLILLKTGKIATARIHIEQYLEIMEPLVEDGPDEVGPRLGLISQLGTIAKAYLDADSESEALNYYSKALLLMNWLKARNQLPESHWKFFDEVEKWVAAKQ